MMKSAFLPRPLSTCASPCRKKQRDDPMTRNPFCSSVLCLPLPVACLFLLLVTATSSQAVDCVKIRVSLQQQKGLIERSAILKQAVQDCPDDALINYFYAYNLERLRKYEQALHAYEKTLRLDQKFAKAHFGLGDMHLVLGNAGEAIPAFERGLALAPDNIRAQRSLKQARTLYAEQKRTVAGQKKPDQAEPVVMETVREKAGGETVAVADTVATVQETPVDNRLVAVDSEAAPAEKPGNNIHVADLTQAAVIGYTEQALKTSKNELEITSSPLSLPIEFESNSSQLTAESKIILDEAICPALLDEKLAGAAFELAGHTDSYGSFEHNMNLSRLRVHAVKKYLTDRCNIDSARLQGVYYGPFKPLVPNKGRENSKQNRRVEIRRLP
ncbi:MAG: OmpA family protein [Desulfobulbaceae bacterium]|nr:OmpA family protein [Desulfobulbaceae bacterium]